jgi:hypothetical protein
MVGERVTPIGAHQTFKRNKTNRFIGRDDHPLLPAKSVGGAAYIAGLVDGVPERPSIAHYVSIVRNAASRKRAAKLAEKAQQLAEDPSIPITAVAEIGNDLTQIAAGDDMLPPRFSEEALALRFSRQFRPFSTVRTKGSYGVLAR